MIGLEKGDIITIEITDMTEEGAGVGHIEGMTVFVSGGAVIGDTVSCELTKVKKNYALANLKEVIEYSKHRREDVCSYINDCGGCALGMLNYDAQLELKVNQLKNKLVRIAGVESPKIDPMIAYEPYLEGRESAYRNKAVMAVGEDEDGNPIVGFRGGKSHRIVDCETCLIQLPPVMALADALREYMREYGVRAYNPRADKGLIKSLMVRTTHARKEVMAAVSINGTKLPEEEEFAYILDDSIQSLDDEYSLESIIIIGSNGKSRVLAGKQRIRDELMGLRFDISAESFYQVNSEQTVKLYEEALRMLDAKEGERIIDAYCGIGTIGLIAASRTKAEFLGIESVPQAVLDANKNAIRNLIVNALFIEGKAEEVLVKLVADASKEVDSDYLEHFTSPDAVIVDPPRAGCAPELIDAVVKAKPNRIVYVSCDQGTLARDVKLLIDGGYELKETTPCDMFPDTGGLESVSLLMLR